MQAKLFHIFLILLLSIQIFPLKEMGLCFSEKKNINNKELVADVPFSEEEEVRIGEELYENQTIDTYISILQPLPIASLPTGNHIQKLSLQHICEVQTPPPNL